MWHITVHRSQQAQVQLLRNLISSQQPAAQHLLQALVARVKDVPGAPGGANPRPNSRASLTGSGGKPAVPGQEGPAAAVAALQALLARQAGTAPAAGTPPVTTPGPPDGQHTVDEVLRFLLDYVPETAAKLPGPACSPLSEHLDQVAGLVAKERLGVVTYLTHVMAPPTNAAGAYDAWRRWWL